MHTHNYLSILAFEMIVEIQNTNFKYTPLIQAFLIWVSPNFTHEPIVLKKHRGCLDV